jgi:N-(5-amino-5-carboxypentanoyl)-L-cysteinyl-D-valine synthase
LRIELGEIEAAISSYPGISQSVVVCREHQMIESGGATAPQKYLAGYYVSSNGSSLVERDVKRFLQSKLPEYMIHVRLVRIEKIPVTINGKLDTKLLRRIELSKSSNEYVVPRDEVETKLCNIWSELLRIPAEHVGIKDDSFSLGGDSLMTTKLSFMITSTFKRNISGATVFKHNTIESQSHLICNEYDEAEDIEHLGAPYREATVSFSQERLLFIDEFENGTPAYNIAINSELSNNVDRDTLKHSLRSVLSRHRALRTLLPIRGKDSLRLQHVLDEQVAQSIFPIYEYVVSNAQELDELLIKHIEACFLSR